MLPLNELIEEVAAGNDDFQVGGFFCGVVGIKKPVLKNSKQS